MVSFSTEHRNWLALACAGALCVALWSPGRALSEDKDKPAAAKQLAPVPTAIVTFQDRGGKDNKAAGVKVTDLLFAELVAKPEMFLVDREELSKVLAEHEINLSGAVNPDQAIQVGQLTGAKLIVTGSVVQVESNLYLVAKIIGTETTRVLGASVKGKSDDDLGRMVEKLANEIAETISTKSDQLIAKTVTKEDRLEALKKKLGDKKRPSVVVAVRERHVTQIAIDPAAQTELEWYAKETGFPVVDRFEGDKSDADILLVGEGFSEFGGRFGNLASVKARLEVKAIDRRTGRVLAVDRQTTVALDLTEQIAGKTALQEAAAKIAERMLPKLLNPEGEKKPGKGKK
ncbi:MAG: CsgG/HfaB family protein [Planctomycetaceae bacterium]